MVTLEELEVVEIRQHIKKFPELKDMGTGVFGLLNYYTSSQLWVDDLKKILKI